MLVPGLVGSIYVLPLAIGFLAVPLLAIQDNLEAIARSLHRPLLGIGPAYVVRQGVSVFVFAGLALSPMVPSPGLALLGAIGGILASIAVQAVLLRAAFRQAVPPGPRRYAVRCWLRMGLPIALVDATELLLLNADVLVVGLFLSPQSVAIYFAQRGSHSCWTISAIPVRPRRHNVLPPWPQPEAGPNSTASSRLSR
jgi:O-antigen/teichoic acid export membrane protein